MLNSEASYITHAALIKHWKTHIFSSPGSWFFCERIHSVKFAFRMSLLSFFPLNYKCMWWLVRDKATAEEKMLFPTCNKLIPDMLCLQHTTY